MHTPSKRIADTINLINTDSVTWALRHVIDEALILMAKPDCTIPEMKALLEYGSKFAADALENSAIHFEVKK